MESTLQYVKFQTKERPELPAPIFGHAIEFPEAITGSQANFWGPWRILDVSFHLLPGMDSLWCV